MGQPASNDILSRIRTAVQATIQNAAQGAGNALFSGAPAAAGKAMSAQDELTKLQKDGPPDAMHYGSWQQRMDDLQKQIRAKK